MDGSDLGAKCAALLKDPEYCAKRVDYANQLFIGGPKLFPDIRQGLLQMLADYNDNCDGFVYHILGRLYKLAGLEEQSMEYHTEGYKRLQFTLHDAQCQHAMGWLFEAGKPVAPGFKKDPHEALKWYMKSAEQGYLTAIYAIGTLYKSANLGPPDYDKAMEWFLKAGNLGYPNAQHSVGLMYKQGGGSVKVDYEKCLEWYHKAALQGYGSAEYSIGILYNQGFGVVQDFVKAREWFTKAADQGYAMPNIASDYCIKMEKEWRRI